MNFIVTDTDQTLRNLALDRSSYFPNRSPFLAYDVEYFLVRLIEKEVELVRTLNSLLSELVLRYDYNPLSMFSALDEFSLNYLTVEK